MATTAWYVRSTGSDLNSGGSDSDAARVTRDAGTPGTVAGAGNKTLTDAGATFQTSGVTVGDAVNIQVAGVSSIYEINSVDSETQITLVGGPANAAYNYRIGGARTLLSKVVNSGAGKNIAIAANDTVDVKANDTVTDAVITMSAGGIQVRLRGATIDGTGGGAASDVFVSGQNTLLIDGGGGSIVNAVDRGIDRTGGSPTRLQNLIISACGGIGLSDATLTTCKLQFVSVRSCSVGLSASSGTGVECVHCEFVDCSGNGATARIVSLSGVLVARNGGDGWNHNGNALQWLDGCTFTENTGDGLEMTGTAQASMMAFVNNVLSNNGGKGVNCSGGALTTTYWTDYNDFYTNTGGDRANFNTGAHDTAVDPGFVSLAGDDYTLDTGSALIGAGYSPFKSPMKLNQGATIAEVATAGGGMPPTLFIGAGVRA